MQMGHKEINDKICKLLSKGLNHTQIGKIIGRHQSSISRRIKTIREKNFGKDEIKKDNSQRKLL